MADKTIELLNRKAIKRFEQARLQASVLGFDELNVIKTVKSLYADLAADNQQAFLDLAQYAYWHAKPHGREEPDIEWLLALLDSYDPVTLYVYEHEVERKRDRTTEAINSTKAKAQEYRKGLSYWAQMTAHYADEANDKAIIKSFRDAGVKKARWRTQEDEKVCEECGPRDGKVFLIDRIPPKPHWGCRCWLEAVK